MLLFAICVLLHGGLVNPICDLLVVDYEWWATIKETNNFCVANRSINYVFLLKTRLATLSCGLFGYPSNYLFSY